MALLVMTTVFEGCFSNIEDPCVHKKKFKKQKRAISRLCYGS